MGATDPLSAPPSEGSSNEFFYAAALPSRQASVREAGPAPGSEQPLAIPVAAASAADEAVANLVWNQSNAVAGPEAGEAPSASAAAQQSAWPVGNFRDLTDSVMWPRLEVQPALPAVQEAQAEEHPEATPPAPAQAQQPAAEEGEQWSLSAFCVASLLTQARQLAAVEGEQWYFL